MLSADVYNKKGEKAESIKLNELIFNVNVNPDLIKQVYISLLSSARHPVAHTKTRGEVSGGGIKPWRQKGTGRARHGSIRSPIWIGGGTTFGPRNERNFERKVNKKQKQKALFMVLSAKLNDGEIYFIDDLNFDEFKTKNAVEILNNLLKEEAKKSVLVVLDEKNKKTRASFRNIPNVETIYADSLNVVDLLHSKYLILTKNSVSVIENTYKKLINK